MMTNGSITLYNKFKDGQGGERWKRTVIPAAFWDGTNAVTASRTGLANADSVSVFIPYSIPGYMKPKAWQPETGWTLQAGDKMVRGAVDYEIQKAPSELSQSFDDVITITSIAVNTFGSRVLWHFEIGGK